MPATILFDAYGTLFDVHALESQLDARFPGKGRAISKTWREKQLQYTWIITLSGRYQDFWTLTGSALDYACEAEGAVLTAEIRGEVLNAYEKLPMHREVPAALRALHGQGHTLGVLTNAGETMVRKALAAADAEGLFAHVLSVEPVAKYKTTPESYQVGVDAVGAPASRIVFVSSNSWDAAGATWFGYRAYWVNRAGAPKERIGGALAGVGRTMDDLVAYLAR